MGSRAAAVAIACFALLASGRAHAAPVRSIYTAQNIRADTRTLRLPAGTSNLDFRTLELVHGYLPSPTVYVAVGVAISDANHRVSAVNWTDDQGRLLHPLRVQTFRDATAGAVACRSEMWGDLIANNAVGHIEVVIEPVISGAALPTLAASMIAFRSVSRASIGGPCCNDSSASGSGTSTINKTMFGAGPEDVLMNSVCTSWSGAEPGGPTADPAANPEMSLYTSQTFLDRPLQNFTGVSPGSASLGPRHLRWLQTGSRVWSIVGLILVSNGAPAPDAGPDASPPDLAPPVDARPPDGQPPGEAPDAVPSPDLPSSPDTTPTQPDGAASADGAGDAVVPLDAGPTPPPRRDADALGRDRIDWRVSCACEIGSPQPRGGGWLLLALLAAVARARAARRRN